MAIASGANREKIYMLFGIPSGGASYETGAIATLWGPFGETYDHSAIVTALDAKLTAADAGSALPGAQVETELGYWDGIRANPELVIYEDTGSRGVLANYKAREEIIRQRIAGLIGFYVPKGGFKYGRPADNDCRITR